MKLEQILVAVDFSPISDGALARAVALAKAHDARLIVAHAEAHANVGATGSTAVGEELALWTNELAAAERRELDSRAARLRELSVTFEIVTRSEAPATLVTDLAEERGVDLIVVGTHGRSGIKRFLLGSVTEKVIRKSPCHVLVSRGAIDPDGRFDQPLIATEFTDETARAVSTAKAMSETDAPLTLIHAWQYPVGSWGVNLLGAGSRAAQAVRGSIVDSAQQRGDAMAVAQRLATHGDVQFVLVEGHAADAITAHAEAHGHDLIVVGSHGRRGLDRALLGSVAEATVRHATCSVLVTKHPPS